MNEKRTKIGYYHSECTIVLNSQPNIIDGKVFILVRIEAVNRIKWASDQSLRNKPADRSNHELNANESTSFSFQRNACALKIRIMLGYSPSNHDLTVGKFIEFAAFSRGSYT